MGAKRVDNVVPDSTPESDGKFRGEPKATCQIAGENRAGIGCFLSVW